MEPVNHEIYVPTLDGKKYTSKTKTGLVRHKTNILGEKQS
jgi:hypothetical protein